MDSINTDERVEGFMAIMLEGYETNLTNITQFIDRMRLNLMAQRPRETRSLKKLQS